ncbi:MAG: tyrosine-type recombinase/integrase [Saprospiraceae bacterium]
MANHMSLANHADASIYSYLTAVKSLIVYYGKEPEQCTVDEIKAFLIHERDKLNLSSSTVNLRVCGIKYYFRNVVNRLDLVVKIPNPRIQRYDTEILTISEVLHLFRSCRDMRQSLVLHILYETGIRSLELCRLRPEQFDKHESTIVIRNSKGKKTRTVEYGQSLRKVLVDYCKVRGGLPKNTLIDSYKEQDVALTIRGIQWIVKEVVRRSGIKKNVSPHTFRHTFAVHYLNRGGSIFRLQQLMGHEYITTTLHYLKYASIPESTRVSLLDHLYGENPGI